MNDKIRVLHIIKSLGRGGAEMLLPESLKLHDKEKFTFYYIYFLPWKNQMVESLQQAGGEVICFAAKNNIRLMLQAKKVARYVRDHNIQLIHAHLPWAGIVARMVGKLSGVPVIYTEHNKQERYHFATRTMNLLTMNYNREVVAVSDDVAQSIKKHKPSLKTSLRNILNGVNINHFAPQSFSGIEIRKQLRIPDKSPIIGTIAVFRFQKRLDLWMELAKQILEHKPDAHFIIVGDGPLKVELTRKCNDLRLNNRLHMVGLQTEVRPYLAAFDLYMITSIFEGLPIAMLEAMAATVPVISTDAGGIKEVIRHEIDGLLCHVDHPENLVTFALSLLKDDQKRQLIGMAGRRRIEQSFSMDKMVDELEALYIHVLNSTLK